MLRLFIKKWSSSISSSSSSSPQLMQPIKAFSSKALPKPNLVLAKVRKFLGQMSPCDVCHHKVSKPRLMRKHYLKFHPKQIKFDCSCGNSFPTPAGLSNHEHFCVYLRAKKASTVNYICNEKKCGVDCGCAMELIKHSKRVHGASHHCKWCGIDSLLVLLFIVITTIVIHPWTMNDALQKCIYRNCNCYCCSGEYPS